MDLPENPEKNTPPLRKLTRETSSPNTYDIALSAVDTPILQKKRLSSSRARSLSKGESSRSRAVSKEDRQTSSGEPSQEEHKFTRRKSGRAHLRFNPRRTPTNSSEESDMHSSSSPMIIEDGDSEIPLGSPIKQEVDKKQLYMESVNALLQTNKSPSEIAKNLVYSYPIFMDEKYFFEQLKSLKSNFPKIIIEFLNQLTIEGFPNGLKNLLSAREELQELKKGLGNFPLLDKVLLGHFSQNDPSDEGIDKLFIQVEEIQNLNGMTLDIGDFAVALSFRDKALFRRIPLNSIRDLVITEELTKHSDQTCKWVALQIVTAPTLREREKLLQKFGCLFRFLLKRQNFHGAMQIAHGLQMLTVTRLKEEDNKTLPPKPPVEDLRQRDIDKEQRVLKRLSLSRAHIIQPDPMDEPHKTLSFPELKTEPLQKVFASKVSFLDQKVEPLIQKKEDENWQILSSFINSKHNYQVYRECLSKASNAPIETSNYLPFFSLIQRDVLHGYEVLTSTTTPKKKIIILQEIAEAVQSFSKSQTLAYPEINLNYLKLVCSFDVHLETLEVYSDLRKLWGILEDRDTKNLIPLNEWTPWYFASFLRQKGWLLKKVKKIEEIFALGIHEGKHLIKRMGTGNIKDQEENLSKLGLEPLMIDDIIAAYYLQLIKGMETNDLKKKEGKLLHLGITPEMVKTILNADQETVNPKTENPSSSE